ncbi:MAG: sodium-dependent transporter [Clostridiales bacterium]|nr:sodium-dependent transporter [Clostridiales bacterium]
MEKREHFSKLGHVLVAAGSAVGLGNIWKFPTLAGQNGGGIFILFYLFFVLVVGVPLILGESTIGRYAQKGPVDAYHNIAAECGQKGFSLKFWTFLGFTGAFANFIILCYYSVIAGWILQYCIKVLLVPLNEMDMALFGASISSYVTPIVYALVFLAVTIYIDVKGITAGVEKCSKFLMPLLIVLLIVCAVCSLSLPGSIEGVKYMLIPNTNNAVNAGSMGYVALAALGQCFFSLSLGTGQMITLGSYLGKDSKLASQSYGIPAVDTGVALLAGFVTLPAVFAVASVTGIDPTSQTGPGMLMYALPQSLYAAFGSTFGTIIAFLMFLLVCFAALTSTTSMVTVTASYLEEYKHVEHRKATIGIGLGVAVVSVICSLSNTPLLDSITFGGMNIQDSLDWFISNLLMPFGAFFMCVFIGYIWKAQNAIKEITNDGTVKFSWATGFKWIMMVVDPLIILVVFLSGIGILKF